MEETPTIINSEVVSDAVPIYNLDMWSVGFLSKKMFNLVKQEQMVNMVNPAKTR